MNNNFDLFKQKFRVNDLEVLRVGSWVISVRPQQITLGSLILFLDRECDKLSNITLDEGQELSLAFKKIDDLLIKTFAPDKINYLALMMIDNQVHFHIIPRYQHKVEFKEITYEDLSWPNPPTLIPLEIDDEVLKQIVGCFRKNI